MSRPLRRLGAKAKDVAVDALITVGLVALCIRHLIFGGD